eukprot:1141884-Pelagomonas_calceolata.AAC.7
MWWIASAAKMESHLPSVGSCHNSPMMQHPIFVGQRGTRLSAFAQPATWNKVQFTYATSVQVEACIKSSTPVSHVMHSFGFASHHGMDGVERQPGSI